MIRIYYNPDCSKSRACLALVEASGLPFETVDYLSTPLDKAEILALAGRIGCSVRALVRDGEAAFRAQYAEAHLDDEGWAEAIVGSPRLLQRPIAVRDGRAVVARPPERVMGLLG